MSAIVLIDSLSTVEDFRRTVRKRVGSWCRPCLSSYHGAAGCIVVVLKVFVIEIVVVVIVATGGGCIA